MFIWSRDSLPQIRYDALINNLRKKFYQSD